MFADVDAGRSRGDGTKEAADASRSVRFQVEGFMLRGAAPHEKLKAAFEAPRKRSLGAEQAGPAETAQGKAADLQEFTPEHPVAQPSAAACQVKHDAAFRLHDQGLLGIISPPESEGTTNSGNNGVRFYENHSPLGKSDLGRAETEPVVDVIGRERKD